jgi:phosphate transport system permease protein
VNSVSPARAIVIGLRRRDSATSPGDLVLHGVCLVASILAVLAMALIAYEVIEGARPAISRFGLGFIVHTTWKPNFFVFGAGSFLFGTAVTSGLALLVATPIGIAIGLYLSLLAPKAVRGVISPLVEMIAAIPTVILGFWGILVLGPFLSRHVEPWIHAHFGFLPLFGPGQTTGSGVFNATIILTIMIIPIVASLSRDLFLTVPAELRDGAAALGATRWETIRGIVLPSTASGVTAAAFLGLGRALGEAIAVTQVIGGGNALHASLFQTGDTLASRIALQFTGAENALQTASLFYLALMLLVIGVLTNLLAQLISGRFGQQATFAR